MQRRITRKKRTKTCSFKYRLFVLCYETLWGHHHRQALKVKINSTVLQEDEEAIVGMTWEGVDMFGEEQKILKMAFLNVAEEHGRKGLGTRLVKVSIITCCSGNEFNLAGIGFGAICAEMSVDSGAATGNHRREACSPGKNKVCVSEIPLPALRRHLEKNVKVLTNDLLTTV